MRVVPVLRSPFCEHACVIDSYLNERRERVDHALQRAQERVRRIDDAGPQAVDMEQRASPYLTDSTFSFFTRMLCVLTTKPYHLPIFLAMSFLLLTHSDARVPKKPHPIADKVRLLHHTNTDSHPTSHTVSPAEVFAFSKRISREAWRHNTTEVTNDFRREFGRINQATRGDLGNTLTGVFEIRLLDLQHAVRHAKAVVDIMKQLSGEGLDPNTGCPFCEPISNHTRNIKDLAQGSDVRD